MTETFISTFRELCSALPYLYVLMFMLCIGVQKQLSSLSITIILVACAEFIMDTAASPLLTALNDKTITYEVRASIWAISWCYMYAIAVYAFEKSHHWLNIQKGKELFVIQLLFGFSAVLELFDYINLMVFKFPSLFVIYEIGLPALGLAIGLYLITQLLLSIKDRYVNRDHSASNVA